MILLGQLFSREEWYSIYLPGAEACASPNIDPQTFVFKTLVSKEVRTGNSKYMFQAIGSSKCSLFFWHN